ncbi:MAG: ComF family protein [Aliishimia sp.]
MLSAQVQTTLRAIFPPSCLSCRGLVASDYGLCGECWRDLPLISGPACRSCGIPVLAEADDDTALCEDCTARPRPWRQGRSALHYKDLGRKLVLGLKHNDRHDIAPAAGLWLSQAAKPLLESDTIIAPVPLHWSRLVKRRYNQSAVLVHALGTRVMRRTVLDLLIRTERTLPLDGVSVEQRFKRMAGVIQPNPKRLDRIVGAKILLVDDVMTSGATFAACTEACLAAGAARVDVLSLARVAKDEH